MTSVHKLLSLAGEVPAGEPTLSQQAAWVEHLRTHLARDGQPVQCIETHISWVLVAGDRAWKMKKALRTPFLDAVTRERRRHHAEDEVRLNRRLAPDLYLGVAALTGPVEAPVISRPLHDAQDASPPVHEWLVEMRAFDPRATWDRRVAMGAISNADVDILATTLAAFQAVAPVAGPEKGFGTPERIHADMHETLQALHEALCPKPSAAVVPRALSPAAPSASPIDAAILEVAREDLAVLDAWARTAEASLAPEFAHRLAEGRVREGHGDLHLGNVVQIDGHPTVFDGIDFNAGLRWIDAASEVAFLAMDLAANGQPELGHRFVNAWLEAGGDYDAVRVLDFYRAYRALVRARVALMRASQPGEAGRPAATKDQARAAHYLSVARAMIDPLCRCADDRPCTADGPRVLPALMITHGPSGSGKSTLTQGLVEQGGAVRIRADVERKRLAGLAPLTTSRSPLHGGLYTPEWDEQVLERLFEAARAVIDGGRAAILDATFLRRGPREAACELARQLGVPWRILHLVASENVLRARVRARRAGRLDASEADEAVLDEQLRTAQSLRPSEWAVAYNVQAMPDGVPAEPRAEWSPLIAQLRIPLSPA